MLPGHHRTAERIRFLRESTEIKSVLARVRGVRSVDFRAEGELEQKQSEIWRRVSSLEAAPSLKVEIHDDDSFDWLDRCVHLLNLQNICYVVLGGYSLPWIELEITERGWVETLTTEQTL